MVLLRRRDCAGGVGPAVEAPRTDAPRPMGGTPAVKDDAGAAVVVVPGCEVDVDAAAAEEGFSGFLNKVLNGTLVEVVCAADEVGVCEAGVA
jgi:hypothetical protein